MMTCVNIEDDLTIFTAAEMKPKIMSWLGDDNVTELDLSAVNEMDTAGFQLLVLALREAKEKGKSLKFVGLSDSVQEVVSMFGREQEFAQGT